MALTWKRWGIFLALIVGWTVLGHWYATRNLAGIYLNHHGGPDWPLDKLTGNLQRPRIPWQTGLWSDAYRRRAFDPDHPQTADPEILMGIALLGAQPDCYYESSSKSYTDYWNWFGRVARLSLDCAKKPETQNQLRGMLLMNLELFRPHWVNADEMILAIAPLLTLKPSSDNETYAQNLASARQRIDPTNAFYLYRNAAQVIDKRIVYTDPKWPPIPLPAMPRTRPFDHKPPTPSPEVVAFYKRRQDPRPSVQSAQDFALAEPDKIIPYAKEIDDLLTQCERQGKIRFYTRYWETLVEKGSRFYWGDDFNQRVYLHRTEPDIPISGLSRPFPPLSRDGYERLCYLGDVLATKGHNDMALRMYRHIYDHAYQPIEMVGDSNANMRLNQSLENLRCLNLHLMEFWTNQKDARKVLAIHKYIPRLENSFHSRYPRDTLIEGNEAGSLYPRMGVLTWWLSSTGLLLAAVSILAALWHVISRRGQYLTGTSTVISGKRYVISIAVAVCVMMITSFCYPFGSDTCEAGTALFIWLYPLTMLGIIGCGMLAKRAVRNQMPVSVGLAEWVFWRASAAGALFVLLFFHICLQRDLNGPGFPSLALVVCCMLLGFLFWTIRVLRGWIRKRQPEDRMVRSAVVKSFAVICAGVASILMPLGLIAALWTCSLQKEAYVAANETYRHQTIAGQTISIAGFEVPDAVPDFSKMAIGMGPLGPGMMSGGPGMMGPSGPMGPTGMMSPGKPVGDSFPGLPKEIFELKK